VLPIEPETGAKLTRRLRKVTARLGPVRELDVLLLLVEELQETGRYNPAAISKVADHVAQERSRLQDRVAKRMPMGSLRRIARKLARLSDALERAESRDESGDSWRAWRWAVDARVARRAASLTESIRAAGALYLPERLHAVRIGVKKLRYALELASEIAGTRKNPDLAALKRMQDVLGRMHDLQMLIDRVRQVQATMAPPDLATWRHLDALTAALEDGCRRLHARYVHERDALAAMSDRLGPKRSTSRRTVAGRRHVG
jgi:CHAD domain-containing protein